MIDENKKPDYITSLHYDKNINLIDKKHVYHDKAFEEFWGDKAEKWNGKLDIKQFSFEIWQACSSSRDKEVEALKKELKEWEDAEKRVCR